jgi:hypothetical protein
MGIVVVALIIAVVYLARKAPDMASDPMQDPQTGSLPPDTNVQPLGATDTPSPATTGGQRWISKPNLLRLRTNGAFVKTQNQHSPQVFPPNGAGSVLGNLTGASYDGGYKREGTPLIVAKTNLPRPPLPGAQPIKL